MDTNHEETMKAYVHEHVEHVMFRIRVMQALQMIALVVLILILWDGNRLVRRMLTEIQEVKSMEILPNARLGLQEATELRELGFQEARKERQNLQRALDRLEEMVAPKDATAEE